MLFCWLSRGWLWGGSLWCWRSWTAVLLPSAPLSLPCQNVVAGAGVCIFCCVVAPCPATPASVFRGSDSTISSHWGAMWSARGLQFQLQLPLRSLGSWWSKTYGFRRGPCEGRSKHSVIRHRLVRDLSQWHLVRETVISKPWCNKTLFVHGWRWTREIPCRHLFRTAPRPGDNSDPGSPMWRWRYSTFPYGDPLGQFMVVLWPP